MQRVFACETAELCGVTIKQAGKNARYFGQTEDYSHLQMDVIKPDSLAALPLIIEGMLIKESGSSPETACVIKLL